VETNRIPFLDLVSPHREIKDELVAVFAHVLDTAGFIGGPMLEDFEKNFAKFCETQSCVGVASGTDALRFALMAAGIGQGDVVVTVPNTFIATTEAITQCGATPDFVDVDEHLQHGPRTTPHVPRRYMLYGQGHRAADQ
jgi:dTDP-4-amino-4,6-dideoxygalactose transaminase